MKTIITFCIGLLFITSNAQSWFDKSCNNIKDDVNQEGFKASSERNILKIIINQAGVIEINDIAKPNLSEISFKELVLDYVTNPKNDKNKADKPEKVFIQLKGFNKDKEQLQNIESYIKDVYLYLWDKASEEKYESTYVDLKCKKRENIFDAFPLKLISEVSKNKKNSNRLRKGPGVPQFGGDVKKN
jgi:hypothetical protein